MARRKNGKIKAMKRAAKELSFNDLPEEAQTRYRRSVLASMSADERSIAGASAASSITNPTYFVDRAGVHGRVTGLPPLDRR